MARLKRRYSLLILTIAVAVFLLSAGGFAAFLGAIILGISAIPIWRIIKKRTKQNASTGIPDVSRAESPSTEKLEYGTRCVTLNGEIVRSKGEKKVADFLFQQGIRYAYEPRVRARPGLSDGRNYTGMSGIIGRPDFLLLDYDILVEYWGMVTVPDPVDRANYQRKMVKKKTLYEQNGYKLISIYSWDLDSLELEFNRQLALLTRDNRNLT